MPESLLDRAVSTAGRVPAYAVVPFAVSLLAFDNVVQTATASGFHVSVKVSLPTAIATVWTVFDPPATGVSFVSPTPLYALPAFLVVNAALTAGYLGGIYVATRENFETRDGSGPPDHPATFLDNVVEYAVPVLGVQVVEFAVAGAFALVLVGSQSVALALFAFPLLVLVGYLLWGAPFLVVARDAGALAAIEWSVSLAFDGGRYFTFALLYALCVVVASLLVSPVLSTGGVPAILVVAAVVAVPSLVASAAAMLVVDDVAADRSRGA